MPALRLPASIRSKHVAALGEHIATFVKLSFGANQEVAIVNVTWLPPMPCKKTRTIRGTVEPPIVQRSLPRPKYNINKAHF
jgi:hypothetical protein